MKIYRGISIPECPNGCFEKFLDKAAEENTVDGQEPKLRQTGWIGTLSVGALRYSSLLGRYGRRANGNYHTAAWKYCPLCGGALIGGEVGNGTPGT